MARGKNKVWMTFKYFRKATRVHCIREVLVAQDDEGKWT